MELGIGFPSVRKLKNQIAAKRTSGKPYWRASTGITSGGKFETRDSVVQAVIGMDNIDYTLMAIRHEAYCAHWDRKGWRFNGETFLSWVRNGMPMPPPEELPSKPPESASHSPLSTIPKFVEPKWVKSG